MCSGLDNITRGNWTSQEDDWLLRFLHTSAMNGSGVQLDKVALATFMLVAIRVAHHGWATFVTNAISECQRKMQEHDADDSGDIVGNWKGGGLVRELCEKLEC